MDYNYFEFECPSCGQHISTTLSDAGIDAVCPVCGNDFVVPNPPTTNHQTLPPLANPSPQGNELHSVASAGTSPDMKDTFSSYLITSREDWDACIHQIQTCLPEYSEQDSPSNAPYMPAFTQEISMHSVCMLFVGACIASAIGWVAYIAIVGLTATIALLVPTHYIPDNTNQYNWTLSVGLPVLHWAIRILGYLIAFFVTGTVVAMILQRFGRKANNRSSGLFAVYAGIVSATIFVANYFLLGLWVQPSLLYYIVMSLIGSTIVFFVTKGVIHELFYKDMFCHNCGIYMVEVSKPISLGEIKTLSYAIKIKNTPSIARFLNSMREGKDGMCLLWYCRNCGNAALETKVQLFGRWKEADKRQFQTKSWTVDRVVFTPEEGMAFNSSEKD